MLQPKGAYHKKSEFAKLLLKLLRMPILCLDKHSIKIPPTQSVKYPPNKLLSNIVLWYQLHCKHFTKCGLIAIPKRSRNGEICIHFCRAVLDVNNTFTNAVPAYQIKMEDITITHFGWWKWLICLCSLFFLLFSNIIITAPHSSQSSVKCLYNDTRSQPQRSGATLRWRHNDHNGVSNHQSDGCLLKRLFRRRAKKTSKLRVTGLCAGNSPGTVNSPHKWPVTRHMFPFDDVIMHQLFHQTISLP